jgi:HPr kinase/phosphorylase
MRTPYIKASTLFVREFYDRHAKALEMELLNDENGLQRVISEPTINRPGLALSGFYEYFAEKRVQVIGSAELSYLKSLSQEDARIRIRELCSKPIPCIVVSRGVTPKPFLLDEAEASGIAVFLTPMVTMQFINAATIALELEFAPSRTEHGSMVDVHGVGVLVRGSSGIGKSECTLGLIERGHSLVSDDITKFRAFEGKELIGTAPDILRRHMEVRGLGIIDVSSIFGVGAIRTEKRLDLVVTLKDWQELEDIDRIGLEEDYYEILGIRVVHVTIPVRMGRDLARLVEVAAMDQKLKSMGHYSALQFNERLLSLMQKNRSFDGNP